MITLKNVWFKKKLHVSVQELHNIMMSPPADGGLKESRDEGNNINNRNSMLRTLFHLNLIIYQHGTGLCVGVSVSCMPKLRIHLYYCVILVI